MFEDNIVLRIKVQNGESEIVEQAIHKKNLVWDSVATIHAISQSKRNTWNPKVEAPMREYKQKKFV